MAVVAQEIFSVPDCSIDLQVSQCTPKYDWAVTVHHCRHLLKRGQPFEDLWLKVAASFPKRDPHGFSCKLSVRFAVFRPVLPRKMASYNNEVSMTMIEGASLAIICETTRTHLGMLCKYSNCGKGFQAPLERSFQPPSSALKSPSASYQRAPRIPRQIQLGELSEFTASITATHNANIA